MGKVLGFVGWPCSGKDEAALYLERVHGAQRFGHSDFIREHAALLGIQIGQTAQLSALFEARAAVEGYGWIARIVTQRILDLWTREPRRLVVVSGVRNLGEFDVYNELPDFQLVKLSTRFQIRLRRAHVRQRPGETQITRELLIVIDNLPGNANIPDLIRLRGPVVTNNGSKSDFYHKLDKLVGG